MELLRRATDNDGNDGEYSILTLGTRTVNSRTLGDAAAAAAPAADDAAVDPAFTLIGDARIEGEINTDTLARIRAVGSGEAPSTAPAATPLTEAAAPITEADLDVLAEVQAAVAKEEKAEEQAVAKEKAVAKAAPVAKETASVEKPAAKRGRNKSLFGRMRDSIGKGYLGSL